MKLQKTNMLYYRITQLLSWFVATFLFKRKVIRNEIKNKKGPFIIIANHQAAYDFVNLIGLTRRPINFVISQSFYRSLPFPGIIDKIGLIPKQQFQTTLRDMKTMKAVIDSGNILAIYPAGLMCEDGLSTPIPAATYHFLKWINADVYMAKTGGTYFAMPKWSKGIRCGRTYMDVYKLFSKEELAEMDETEIKAKAQEALLFDAYREQEKNLAKYRNGDNVEGLENVLYMCPHCKSEFSVKTKNKNTIFCTKCGFEHQSDEYGFLHNTGETGAEYRYVSDWSALINDDVKNSVFNETDEGLVSNVKVHMIDQKRNKYREVGEGELTLDSCGLTLRGVLNGENTELSVPTIGFASLPFSPGKYFEIQHGADIYRCYPEDGRLTMKFVNFIKAYYALREKSREDKACRVK